MSVPRVTSPGIHSHGLGEQLKTTHTIGSPAHLQKYLCNQLGVLGGGFSLSKAAPKHLDATHLSGTHSRDCHRVSPCVPQDDSIHISPQSTMPVCQCAPRAALVPHPQALTELGHTPPTRQPNTTASCHWRNNTKTTTATQYFNARRLLPAQISSTYLMPCYSCNILPVLSIDLCKRNTDTYQLLAFTINFFKRLM